MVLVLLPFFFFLDLKKESGFLVLPTYSLTWVAMVTTISLANFAELRSERCPSRRQERDGSVFIHHSGVSKLAQGDSAPERAWPGS